MADEGGAEMAIEITEARLKDALSKRRWPLIPVDDIEGEEAMFCLTDAEMIAIRVALRLVCQDIPAGSRFGDRLESARMILEQALDVEFHEGRFGPDEEAS
jgi:hypothetical protein